MCQPQGDNSMSVISVTDDNIENDTETVQTNNDNNKYFPNFMKKMPILENSMIEETSSAR